MKKEINDGITAEIPTSALNKIIVILCQCIDFPTELCCNIIIHLLFHYFLSLRSLPHFSIIFNIFNIAITC